jgi:hypothetical protein
MFNLNFQLIASGTALGTMFFSSTIFITLVITRYATLAKLIRDSRTHIENKNITFKSNQEYFFHIAHYEKRLRLLKQTLYLSLFGGVALCISFLSVVMNFELLGVYAFALHLILILLALVTLVYELALSFEALNEHLDIMKSWKDKFNTK